MSSTVDNSRANTAALMQEAKAVRRAVRARQAYNSTEMKTTYSTRDMSREIVLAYMGGRR